MMIYVFFRALVVAILTAGTVLLAGGTQQAVAQNEPSEVTAPFTHSHQDGAQVAKLTAAPVGKVRPKVQNAPAAQLGVADIKAIIAREAAALGVPALLVEAIVQHESRFTVSARAEGNTIGLMQIKLGTARGLGFKGDANALFKPESNIHYGALYLSQAYQLAGGDTCHALARYAGGFKVTKVGREVRAMCAMAMDYMATHSETPEAAEPTTAAQVEPNS